MDINWFPGHMTRAKRMMEENIAKVDCVIEIADARCPRSSRNPLLPSIAKGKKTLLVLNKADIADPNETDRWLNFFAKQGGACIAVNSTNGKSVEKCVNEIKAMMKEKIERDRARGLVNRPIRAMVCGIPNVGKSSFINKLSGRGAAKVGDKPGVTRGKQWITLPGGVELLDTPGILWPKLDDKSAAMNLAFIGSVRDEVLDTEELAACLLQRLSEEYPEKLRERYKIEFDEGEEKYALLEKVSRRRGFIVKGGEIDAQRGAKIVLDEFRGAKIGRITLEGVNDK